MVKPTTQSAPTLQSLVRSTVTFANFTSHPPSTRVAERPRRLTREVLSRIIDEALAISHQVLAEPEYPSLPEQVEAVNGMGRARDPPHQRPPQEPNGSVKNDKWAHDRPGQ
jgi:hypothetical protein